MRSRLLRAPKNPRRIDVRWRFLSGPLAATKRNISEGNSSIAIYLICCLWIAAMTGSLISYLLFVEPRLIGNLDVVSVRVADVLREVVSTLFGPKARFLV